MKPPPDAPPSSEAAPLTEPATASRPAKVGYKERLKAMAEAYGPVAIVLYFVLFFGFWGGCAVAIRYFGWQPGSAAGEAGLWTLAYVGTKLTQPIRIAIWLALTPVAARLVGRKPKPI